MRFSILDVLPITSGSSARGALADANQLARLGDRLGYHRLWYAEHHGMANIASTSPKIMIAHVGACTSRIRLGAGGVMLLNHAPLRVVEQYRTLQALHLGRIDCPFAPSEGRSLEGSSCPESTLGRAMLLRRVAG